MTTPVRPDWDPWEKAEVSTLREAIILAEVRANLHQAAHTICARIDDGLIGFDVMMSDSYAAVRARGIANSIAPVASVLPNGTVDIYHPLRTLPPAVAVQLADVAHVPDAILQKFILQDK